MTALSVSDAVVLIVFLVGWTGYNWVTEHSRWARHGLSAAMDVQRRRWMEVLAHRDLRMIDTAIMTGLQQGTAFFASACIFAIGGCFALLGSSRRIAEIAADLPFHNRLDVGLVEAKLLGLIVIFAYAFFKFGWAYRLFNYCTILIGAIPMRDAMERDPESARGAVTAATRMNQHAAKHFNSGLRGIFFGLAYLGWFLGPLILLGSTGFVIAILVHRQFFSGARKVATASVRADAKRRDSR
ncbi:DUF599 domain-containing protein [Aureimonas leprariae]|uniref:DUF599 family protein n=1 Tax=Plantimonas leprariae TaxID=2615207 RepID=A0A7V7TUV3_9HYPH|nr:DUF599 family protein [Aureimonas leprariae]KAB0676671.1 DUF599 family protein [Aureimonas leprariae]